MAIRERALRQRLELTDRSDQRIPLEYRLTDFARLREIVRRHTPQLRERHALLREFRRHTLVRWLNPLGGLFFAGLAVAGLVKGELVPGVVLLGAALLAMVVYGREVRSIDVGPTGLVLRAPFHSRVIPWREVASVALVDVPTRTGPLQTARIHLHRGKPIDVNMVAEGAIPVFDAVEAAWRRAGTQQPGR